MVQEVAIKIKNYFFLSQPCLLFSTWSLNTCSSLILKCMWHNLPDRRNCLRFFRVEIFVSSGHIPDGWVYFFRFCQHCHFDKIVMVKSAVLKFTRCNSSNQNIETELPNHCNLMNGNIAIKPTVQTAIKAGRNDKVA